MTLQGFGRALSGGERPLGLECRKMATVSSLQTLQVGRVSMG